MGIEDEIANLLIQGFSPTEIIQQGYKKSTVYKVHATHQRDPSSTYRGNWSFENIRLSKERYMPSEVTTIWCHLKNNTPYDFYVANVGIQPEWLSGRTRYPQNNSEWYPQEIRALLKPNNSKSITFSFPIPADLPLGDYTYTFGIEGQFMGTPTTSHISSFQIEWSEPSIIQVKHPKRGIKIFLSHSTKNLFLVRQIENFLDNFGYDVIIAEDIREPGVVLLEKFQRLIRESNLLLALLTSEGVNSTWVIEEVNYAQGINKPLLLFKEDSVPLESDLEWVEFSRYDHPDDIYRKVLESIQNIQKRTKGGGGLVVLGLLALFLLAVTSGES